MYKTFLQLEGFLTLFSFLYKLSKLIYNINLKQEISNIFIFQIVKYKYEITVKLYSLMPLLLRLTIPKK